MNTETRARPSFPADDSAQEISRVPFIALCAVIALATIAIAAGVDGAREDKSWGEVLYWAGLLVVIIAPTLRLAGSSAPRSERILLVSLVGLVLMATQYFVNPLGFNNHDEFGHLRETFTIASTGLLFQHNPIQQQYTYFPGIELATGTFARISGLSVFTSWRIIFVAVRLLTVFAIFLVLERASRSSRTASLGVILYMGSPSFMYFDAHFSYESLALPLGFLLIQRAAAVEEHERRLGSVILFLLLLVALTASHHLAGYIVALILIFVAVAEQAASRGRSRFWQGRSGITALFAALAALAVAAWTLLLAPQIVTHYLAPVLNQAVSSTAGFVTGKHAAGKSLFESQNKEVAPILEQAVGFLSVVVLLVLLAWGLWRLVRSRRLASPLAGVLILVAVTYPATLALRLTLNGSETSNRASGYVFIGLAYVIVAGVFGDRPRALEPVGSFFARLVGAGRSRAVTLMRVLGITVAIAVVFLGGIVVGTARTERLPGPYYPAVTSRAATDPESIAAAQWVGKHLEPNQPLFSDIVNRLLMSSYGRENTVCCYVDDELLPAIFLTPTFTRKDARVMSLDHIRLVVADRRLDERSLSTHLFFERADGGPYYRPLADANLSKFAYVPGVQEIFDSGNITIYDTTDLVK